MSDFEDESWVRVGVASALSKEFQGDQAAFFPTLVETLTSCFPGQTEVRTKGIFKKEPVKVETNFDDAGFGLELTHSGIIATKTNRSRGITLRTEPIPVDACLAELAERIELQAKSNHATRQALAKLLGIE